MASLTQRIGILSKLRKTVEYGGAWHAAVYRITMSDMTQQLNNKYEYNISLSIKKAEMLWKKSMGEENISIYVFFLILPISLLKAVPELKPYWPVEHRREITVLISTKEMWTVRVWCTWQDGVQEGTAAGQRGQHSPSWGFNFQKRK